MQVIFAPWRLDYILSDKNSESCIFCEMAEAEDDEAMLVVHRTRRSIVALNRYPYNNGHLMVAPSRHAESLTELDDEELVDLFKTVRLCETALAKSIRPEGLNIGINVGRCAGAGVLGHLHIHVVPRFSGDSNFMTTVSQVRVIPESLSDTFRQLKSVFTVIGADNDSKT